ncbi:MAG: M16 family metallopeptidase, partial [Methylococcaceae bacterium]
MSARRFLPAILLMLVCICPVLSAAPAIDHWTSPKGIQVFHVPTPGLPLVDIRVVFDAGSARDGQQFGLAAMTSALLDTGAGDWNADAIAGRLDGVGAQLGTGVSRDMAWLSLRSLSLPDQLEVALETAEAILTKPRFDQADFDRERQRALVAIQQRGESPDELAEIAFDKLLYGDHPYAHPENGFSDTLNGLSLEDLIRFHQRYYTIGNALVVVVGDATHADAERMAERLLGGLPVGEAPAPLPEPSPKTTATTEKTVYPSEQTHVLIGTLGLKVNDPDYFPLYVGNHILGGSGLVSLISEAVREKRGLSYSAHSYFYPHRQAGPWKIGLQTRNEKAREALQVALDT